MNLPETVRGALRRTLAERREEYLGYLMDLVARDTRVLGHGVQGGREAAGQEYLEGLLSRMGARVEREAPGGGVDPGGDASVRGGQPGATT